jgi:hypothetical protein
MVHLPFVFAFDRRHQLGRAARLDGFRDLASDFSLSLGHGPKN